MFYINELFNGDIISEFFFEWNEFFLLMSSILLLLFGWYWSPILFLNSFCIDWFSWKVDTFFFSGVRLSYDVYFP